MQSSLTPKETSTTLVKYNSVAKFISSTVDLMLSTREIDPESIPTIQDNLETLKKKLSDNHDLAILEAIRTYIDEVNKEKTLPLKTAITHPRYPAYGERSGRSFYETFYVSNQIKIGGTSGKMYPSINTLYCNNAKAICNKFGMITKSDPEFDKVGTLWVPLSTMAIPNWKGDLKEDDGITWGRIFLAKGEYEIKRYRLLYYLMPKTSVYGLPTSCTVDNLGMADRLPSINEDDKPYPAPLTELLVPIHEDIKDYKGEIILKEENGKQIPYTNIKKRTTLAGMVKPCTKKEEAAII